MTAENIPESSLWYLWDMKASTWHLPHEYAIAETRCGAPVGRNAKETRVSKRRIRKSRRPVNMCPGCLREEKMEMSKDQTLAVLRGEA